MTFYLFLRRTNGESGGLRRFTLDVQVHILYEVVTRVGAYTAALHFKLGNWSVVVYSIMLLVQQ